MLLESIARIIAQLTGAAFAGACLYIALVQHPARMTRPGPRALDEFRATIPRAERLQAPLLIVCLVAIAVDLIVAFSWATAVGGLLMLVVLVQTIATVLPINRILLAGRAEDHAETSGAALTRWGGLHAVRTVLAAAGSIALLIR